MNNTLRHFIRSTSLLSLTVAGASFAQTGTSLIPDGGFEQTPTPWVSFVAPESRSSGARFELVETQPKGGRRAAGLFSEEFARHAFETEAIYVMPGQHYRLSAWVRFGADAVVGDDAPGAVIRLSYLDAGKRNEIPSGPAYIGLGNWISRNILPPVPVDLPREWTRIDVVFQAPADAVWLRPYFFAWNTKGAVYFDNISLEKVSNATKPTPVAEERPRTFLLNGGFEQGQRGWRSFIPADALNAGASFSIVEGDARSGKAHASLASHGFARHAIESPSFAVSPGERYKMSAWLRADASTRAKPGTPGPVIRLTLLEKNGRTDAAGGHYFVGLNNWIGRNTLPPHADYLPTRWTKTEVTFEVPAGVGRIAPYFFAWEVEGDIHFDDISIEKVPVNTPLTGLATGFFHKTLAEKQEELLAALDYSIPGLAPVKQAADKGDMLAAQSAFASWLRTRPVKTWPLRVARAPVQDSPPLRYSRERADAAAVGRVYGGFVELDADFGGNNIDWFHNETRARAAKGEPMALNWEWQWQLNRMFFWRNLGFAYRETGDEKYARAWVAQFRSFIEQCPPPKIPNNDVTNRPDSAWRTLEAGQRISDSWNDAFQCFLLSPSVGDEDLLLFAHAILEHGRYIREHHSKSWANWTAIELKGLYAGAVMFPEFKESTEWKSYSIGVLYRQFDHQFIPDGTHIEYSPGYHNAALASIIDPMRRARGVGELAGFPRDYVERAESAYTFNLLLSTPDRSLPKLNDSWQFNVPADLRRAHDDFFPHRKDFLWMATDGREGEAPTPPGASASHAFDHAGYYVMRSGWERDANYAVFDAGHLGVHHDHQDKLNLVLYAYGRELLYDNGGGPYENSKWRVFGCATYSHSTVIVDGLPQNRPARAPDEEKISRVPLGNPWQSTAAFDYVAGVYDEGYGAIHSKDYDRIATHTRRVFFLKPDIFVVADHLSPNDDAPHTYQARWQLLTTSTRHDPDTGAVVTTDPGKSNLAIVPLIVGALAVESVSGDEPRMLGWNTDSRKPPGRETTPATTVTHTLTGVSGPQTLLTLLLPLRSGASTANPVSSITAAPTAADPGALNVMLTDGRSLNISPGAGPGDFLRVEKTGS